MDESTEMLATRRSRRSTAGNRCAETLCYYDFENLTFESRMEAVMAEMAVEEENKDIEDDIDFVNDKSEPTATPLLSLCSPSYSLRTCFLDSNL